MYKQILGEYMKKLLLAALLLITSVAFAAPQQGGTLVFGRSGDSVSLDPAHASDSESFYASSALYDNLVQFKYGSTEIEPGLAESWEVSANGLEYTFKLRHGVTFSKTKYFAGADFTAKDVVFSLKRQFDGSHPYNSVGGKFSYWSAMGMSDIVSDVVAVDSHTVKITLKKPEAPFIANLAMDFAMILSADYADQLAKAGKQADLEAHPVGTGPFVFSKWRKDKKIIFTANKAYWNGRPNIDRLIFKVIPNSASQVAELKAGSVHIINNPKPADVAGLSSGAKTKVVKQEGLNIGYLALNQEKKLFQDKKVRQAINYAINIEKIVKEIYKGFGKVAVSPIPPTMWSHHSGLKPYNYDPAKAKALLAEAGMPNGFETTLWAMPVSRAYNPNGREMAKMMKADLAKVGIKVKIETFAWKTYLTKAKNGEHDMALLGWTGDNGDPDNFLNILLSSKTAKKPASNRAFWKNAEYTSIVEQAREETDQAKRSELYKKAQEIFQEEAPWRTIAHSVVAIPMLKNVNGFKLDPIGKRRFKDVWVTK